MGVRPLSRLPVAYNGFTHPNPNCSGTTGTGAKRYLDMWFTSGLTLGRSGALAGIVGPTSTERSTEALPNRSRATSSFEESTTGRSKRDSMSSPRSRCRDGRSVPGIGCFSGEVVQYETRPTVLRSGVRSDRRGALGVAGFAGVGGSGGWFSASDWSLGGGKDEPLFGGASTN